MSKRALVTGGAGFIGSFIVDELIRRGYRVTIFDKIDPQVHPAGRLPCYLNKEARLVEGDVRDYEMLKKAVLESEIIFHEAAAVGVGQSQYLIKHYADVNIGGTANLLDILANCNHKVEKLIVAASMSSYGEGSYACDRCGVVRPPLRSDEQLMRCEWELRCPRCDRTVRPIPTDEEARQLSNSVYAITKRAQEEMALNFGRTYGIPVVALRYFNVYGPRQSLSNPYTGVAAIFISRLKNSKPPVIYEDGLQTRDFISVHDVVRANMLALDKEQANYQVFNVGSGVPVTIKGLAETLARLMGLEIEPEITQRYRKGDVRHCFADISKIRQALGFEPQVSFEDGMRELIAWSRQAEAEDKFEQAAAELKARGLVK